MRYVSQVDYFTFSCVAVFLEMLRFENYFPESNLHE